MSTVKRNVKTIVKNTAEIPTDVAATALEVAANATTLATGVVRNAVPATKQLGNIFGKFIYGMVNFDLDAEAAEKKYDETSLADMIKSIEVSSVKAGQDFIKVWDDDEDTKPKADKREVPNQ